MNSSAARINNKTQEILLYQNIRSIWEAARTFSSRSINSAHTCACWLTGRQIVESDQGGSRRGLYGFGIMKNVSKKLTADYGSGFSVSGLQYMRAFYLEYPDFLVFQHTLRVKSANRVAAWKQHAPRVVSRKNAVAAADIPALFQAHHKEPWKPGMLSPNLSWTHYRQLLKVKRVEARSFYEIESVKNNWSARQLERQINSLLFERLLKSRNKKGVIALANKGHEINKPIDIIKEPIVLEFLDLPEAHQLTESKVEAALITKLQDFLLELGSGFAYVGRQKRLTLDGDNFYPDLVFYHIHLKCYVIVDLKTRKLNHGDLGQMLLLIHYYDREVKTKNENPTLGLIFCTDKNDAVVKYVLEEKQRQIFAARYQYFLPSEEDLAQKLKREMAMLSFPPTARKPKMPKRKL
jgi:predicted nuclease of restriction endonuclease-like (RecB) superfamily